MKTDKLTSTYLHLREKLHRSALLFLRNDEDAKDAVQETFYNLFKQNDIKSDIEARRKLFTILKNLCIDQLRKPKLFSLNETEIEKNFFKTDFYEDRDRYEKLLTSGLTKIQMEIYHLLAHRDMEYEEIAKKLQMSVEAVRMNMCRARKKMRENIHKFKL